MKNKGGLAVILGMKPGKMHSPETESDDDEGSACEVSLQDAFRAIRKGDKEAFVESMRDAIAAMVGGDDDTDDDED
jgi:hypothetical protein